MDLILFCVLCKYTLNLMLIVPKLLLNMYCDFEYLIIVLVISGTRHGP